MGDSDADSVTNCTEGLAGVEVCGPVQGEIDVINFKTFGN